MNFIFKLRCLLVSCYEVAVVLGIFILPPKRQLIFGTKPTTIIDIVLHRAGSRRVYSYSLGLLTAATREVAHSGTMLLSHQPYITTGNGSISTSPGRRRRTASTIIICDRDRAGLIRPPGSALYCIR